MTPEMAAAVAKIMRNQDLILALAKGRGGHALSQHHRPAGPHGRAAAAQHPTDDKRGIAASIVDGLLLRLRRRGHRHQPGQRHPGGDGICSKCSTKSSGLAIPTQACVLTHVTTTIEAMEKGAPVDLVFQSIAGTQARNAGSASLANAEGGARGGVGLRRGTLGDNVMYFETGQGSALSANAHHGVDQQT